MATIESLLLLLSCDVSAPHVCEEQKHHIPCLQDPPGIELYTIVGYLNKGGVRLPVLRGSTSTFKRGQKPCGDSRWSKELAAIDKCPKHKSTSANDVYGKKIVCHCGYHDRLPPPSKPGSAGSSVAGVEGSHTHQSAVQPPSSSSTASHRVPSDCSTYPLIHADILSSPPVLIDLM